MHGGEERGDVFPVCPVCSREWGERVVEGKRKGLLATDGKGRLKRQTGEVFQ